MFGDTMSWLDFNVLLGYVRGFEPVQIGEQVAELSSRVFKFMILLF